jgi:hypothetical protein
MKANEIRICNYVWNEVQQKAIQVNLKVLVDLLNGIDWQPIPLTEEWLLRFGFEKDNELNFVKFSFKVHFWSSCNSYMYGWIGGNIELKYVHQLQNLYFSLTGKELTI